MRKYNIYVVVRRHLSVLGLGVLLFLSASAESGTLPEFDRVYQLASTVTINDVELADQDGKPFKLSELHGKVALVFFGFTNCPDVCPLTMSSWRILERSGQVDLDRVEFVLISVDGERDTPEVMKKYLKTYSDNFLGLTADPEKVRLLARQFSASFFKGNPTAHDNHYDVTHSTQSFILDASGALRAELYNPPTETTAAIVRTLLAESIEPGDGSDTSR